MLPLTLGVRIVEEDGRKGISVAMECLESQEVECGVLFYDKKSGKCLKRHVIPSENVIGNVKYDFIENIDMDNVSYLFFEGNNLRIDSYAPLYMVDGNYGVLKDYDDYKAVLSCADQYDWEGVKRPMHNLADSILYCLHVRGFTMHESSGVIARGTFAGIIEKLPYLEELGITTLELQPCYEFIEAQDMPYTSGLNYWGYKEGFYYAPKRAYSFSEDPIKEFKDMVKECHKRNIEVILQFYFPDQTARAQIPGILRYWSYHFQVDGFHLKGSNLPLQEIITDPYLSEVKLMHHYMPVENRKPCSSDSKRLALYDEEFLYNMRRFVKGDEGVLSDALYSMRRNPEKTGVINFFSNYYGFTMMDMVSYNRKHNEANGEQNRDGSDYNYTWNCGEEGPSGKRNVNKIRRKQLYNSFVLLMLSQGTPLFFMGDEFGNSQNGNNNPYCQDNEIAWLNWKDKTSHKELFRFVKSMIAFRKKNKVFHQDTECVLADPNNCGFPQLSYHDQSAWMPSLLPESHHIAFMLCGDYAKGNEKENWYVAINMHWEPHEFALPRQPEHYSWEKMLTTESTEEMLSIGETGSGDQKIVVGPRSIAVFVSSEHEKL